MSETFNYVWSAIKDHSTNSDDILLYLILREKEQPKIHRNTKCLIFFKARKNIIPQTQLNYNMVCFAQKNRTMKRFAQISSLILPVCHTSNPQTFQKLSSRHQYYLD